ncbi:putative metallo-beta-lactamase, sterile alpha motif/pointed domain-containing protein [Rosa chinensis]|uniref:Putative metallo-beta-lactamase, sterile alpha motif/pointed domain-containing protein n=1 Tax=Rosa chinensis TaxID=74649 RepID=A0A2P6PZL7_ROSCH|nr:DNA cross-link repair protein SNM1 [Rosa chinensis]PRQ27388.1 putative metallo-beta-lactamase, sterile alpha motif/pointed domain-containing protein [Rosa chinensis]
MASKSRINLIDDDDDDFQTPLTQTATARTPFKKPIASGKENVPPPLCFTPKDSILNQTQVSKSTPIEDCSLDSLPESLDWATHGAAASACVGEESEKGQGGYFRNSIESRLIKPGADWGFGSGNGEEIDVLLLRLNGIEEEGEGIVDDENGGLVVQCPLCEIDISELSNEERQLHTNDCLDKQQVRPLDEQEASGIADDPMRPRVSGQVVEWLRGLGLDKYEQVFIREEIDWDALQWLTEEDLFNIGITALGPRKKIVHALAQLRQGTSNGIEAQTAQPRKRSANGVEVLDDALEGTVGDSSKSASNKLITDYFPGFGGARKHVCTTSREQQRVEKRQSAAGHKRVVVKNHATNRKLRDVPSWCRVPGTPFRVDAFKYLRRDCSHWFLTHFHMDHYQGLTKSFCHGKIYCSSITAKLVNMKLGIPWDSIQVVPLNRKINIAGIDVTCLDANHCPGSIIILFEPPNSKAVLHTGDFRFSEDAASMTVLRTSSIHTLILDTTYCNPQYDFPKQEAVIQFVVDAIQAETFNPKTLFLIGSYTIGKERLYLEVARVLRKKIYVTAGKLHILKCLDFPEEDMQWFTLNEHESQIHVVPMWTLASFKRLKHVSTQYASRYSLIIAFSPTGWTFGKGKKKSPGRRWQQGTIIRYEVPYSEHSSFTELRQFVKLVSPVQIIPSVNNHGPDSANSMISLLSS